MNKSLTRFSLPLLCAGFLLGCAPSTSSSSSSESSESVSSEEQSSATSSVESLPANLTKADKSDLPYLSSLDSIKGYKKSDWDAYWIWETSGEANSYLAFRKSFTLKDKPTSAIAHIAVESKYYLWVNGVFVVDDGGSKRGPTKYDSFYQDVDLAAYLKSGNNVIAVMADYFGKSANSSIDPGQGGFLFEMSAGSTHIRSDSSWKLQRLKSYRNTRLLRSSTPNLTPSSYVAEWNTYYDAAYEVADWQSESFDDSSWSSATVVGVIGYQPFNDTYRDFAPLMAFDASITSLSSASAYLNQPLTSATTLHLALPKNMQFSPYFELTSDKAGNLITYYTDTYFAGSSSTFKDYYACKAGAQSYESYPWRSGTELIIEAPAGVTFTKIGYRVSSYHSEIAGQFVSENADLNTLWNKAADTLKICMRDTFMDCPERERSPYAGDGTNEIAECFYALDENALPLIKKTLLTMLGWTTSDNILPTRSPSTASTKEIPLQNLAFITAAEQYLLYSGDNETIKAFYPAAINYVKVWSMDSSTGLIVARPKGTDNSNGIWGWYDWGSGADQAMLGNTWYYYALSSLKEMASGLSLSSDNTFLDERISSIATHFETAFLKNSGYATTEGSYDDRANGLAVVAGLIPESHYDKAYAVLHSTRLASPYMEKYVLQALVKMGYRAEALSRMQERYQAMIDDSCSTLWENWDKTTGTINHGWTGGPLTILSEFYGGVEPTSLGYGSYQIALTDSFSSLTYSLMTSKGKIAYSLSKSSGVTTLKISTITASGSLLIPTSLGTNITLSGDAVNAGLQGNQTIVTLKGGSYTLTIA